LGDSKAVEKWLRDHSKEFSDLSKQRLKAGEVYREDVIHHNMIELVDLLSSNPDMLPSTAAERISLQRLTMKESERTANDIMISIPTIDVNKSLQESAALMIEKNSGIIAVLSENKLVGVLTDWDVTAAVASDNRDVILEKIMTKDVITASPDFSILDIIRELEQYQISAMPVVDQGKVLGMVNSDLIAQRYFLEYLQTH
ncbi:MAG: CBS domain-containing protein, partial [Promethearchaeota archaeon]|jgi:CBS domain-containing protein